MVWLSCWLQLCRQSRAQPTKRISSVNKNRFTRAHSHLLAACWRKSGIASGVVAHPTASCVRQECRPKEKTIKFDTSRKIQDLSMSRPWKTLAGGLLSSMVRRQAGGAHGVARWREESRTDCLRLGVDVESSCLLSGHCSRTRCVWECCLQVVTFATTWCRAHAVKQS